MKRSLFYALIGVLSFFTPAIYGQKSSGMVVFEEPDFPAVDSATIPPALLRKALPAARFASASGLSAALNDKQTALLILPYGSAFPEDRWRDIRTFLLHGGNLLTIGGRPFTRPAHFENGHWQLSPETYAFARQLLISDYQQTPGSPDVSPEVNQDESVDNITELRWQRAYSMVVRLSQEETSTRIGTSGTFDAELKTLLWGTVRTHRAAAPVVELDHYQNDYTGGRWIMVNCQLDPVFLRGEPAGDLIAALAQRANQGAELLRVTPSYPLYLPGEPWQLELQWNRYQQPAVPAKISVTIRHDGEQETSQTFDLDTRSYPVDQTITLPALGRPGFYTAEIHLRCGDTPCGIYHTGFWVRDKAYLDSGPEISVDSDYFRIDGKRVEVIGTTYMASDAQRLYFRYPNPYVWDKDMRQISDAGINMLRTGLWTDWNLVTGNTSVATERTLRTIEAFLMTARKYRLPVQFTFFAFMPEVLGGINPYLDPEALRRENEFVTSVVKPFADVPFLMWDLINEPSFDNPKRFFNSSSNGDEAETAAWNRWLLSRYGSRSGIGQAWHAVLADGPVPAPSDKDGTAQSANDGGRPLAVYDFNLFAQESFAAWAEEMRATIHGTGSKQLITVGQDEGGALTNPSPALFRDAVDFSTVHSWWFNDDLLWDSLAAKQKSMPMLVQETGVMAETNADGRPRRSPWQDGALVEKKIGLAIATGAGAIEWQWSVNALMRSQQEITIGAVRPDGSEKPEAQVLQAYAAFAQEIQGHLGDPEPEAVSILTSQAEQFSVLGAVATEGQHRAVRALEYQNHIASRMVAENHVGDIVGSSLVILPSAQMLRDSTWRALMDYVRSGGNLLITGPVERDEHWWLRDRLQQIGVPASTSSLIDRSTMIQLGARQIEATFPAAVQRAAETLKLASGKSYVEVEYGKGHVFVVSAPIELAESPDVTAMVYKHVLARLGIAPEFEPAGLPSSVLVRSRIFKDSVLYLMSSESSEPQNIDIRDKRSGARIKLQVPASRTMLVLVDRATGATIATYHGPEWPAQ